ncbi:MAG: sensor domain-containing diguanylate cyclase [Alphaproteobacteria bacterium]|nr:MAG: sensor domain-containing diguanylate cyclase [Alphaproteobacteria bacterium]
MTTHHRAPGGIAPEDIDTLLASEQRLRAILEILPHPVVIVDDHDGCIIFVNRRAALLFDPPVRDLLHHPMSSFFTEPGEWERLVDVLKQVPEVHDLESEMTSRSGRRFAAEIAMIHVDYGHHGGILLALSDISVRKKLQEELLHQATTDVLTGISNRAHILSQANQEIRRARRFGRPLSVLMLDIDHFKSINDRYGHGAGDDALRAFVAGCQLTLRQTDLLGRLGGEEFLAVLLEADLATAAQSAERLRRRIETLPIELEGGLHVPMTVSIGVTSLNPSDADIDDLLKRADRILYQAKNSGRNKVCLDDGKA